VQTSDEAPDTHIGSSSETAGEDDKDAKAHAAVEDANAAFSSLKHPSPKIVETETVVAQTTLTKPDNDSSTFFAPFEQLMENVRAFAGLVEALGEVRLCQV
jgi:hypothetical protein